MIEKILESITPQERTSVFIKRADKQGSTPLHYAAYFNCSSTINRLLEVDRSIAYMKDVKGMTALHIAAHQGDDDIMKELLKYCPDCCELVDKRGWNALHFAVNSSSYWAKYAVQVILDTPSLSNLWNEKDAKGNTPLHYHSRSLKYIKALMFNSRVDKMAFNEENLDPFDIALTSEELSDKKVTQLYTEIRRASGYNYRPAGFRRLLGDDIKPKETCDKQLRKAKWEARKARFVSMMKEASQVHLVVDTIIATVAFTAGVTMPGGFIGHDTAPHSGSPILIRNTAFKAFIITNTIAMVQYCSAAFIYLYMPLLFHDNNPGRFTFLLASLAFCHSISAMGAMLLAFVTATFAVLMHSLGLAISNCSLLDCSSSSLPFSLLSNARIITTN